MKSFRYGQNIGRSRHVVSHHDGIKTHADGSPFFDVSIFGRKRKADQFMKGLRKAGYTAH